MTRPGMTTTVEWLSSNWFLLFLFEHLQDLAPVSELVDPESLQCVVLDRGAQHGLARRQGLPDEATAVLRQVCRLQPHVDPIVRLFGRRWRFGSNSGSFSILR